MRNIAFSVLFLLTTVSIAAQDEATSRRDSVRAIIRERYEAVKPRYNADSVRRVVESGPYFTLYKDNYFIGGIPIGDRITSANSNVKFQLSISQKLTRSKLPFDTYLFIQFTQKTIWNVFEESLPIYDLNFNPGVGIGHLIIHKNRYVGRSYLMLEHESNGKDGINSRSWNKVTVGATYYLTKNFEVQGKFWIPIVDGENNKDILKYCGLGQAALSYQTNNKRLKACVITTFRKDWWGMNTQWELSYKINNNENQYMFLQYYNGYGEYLLDYDKFQSMLRIGFVIKPQGSSIF
ncbi:MAG: phospholipase A [Tannerella sp.]|jgi:phospholipase A1|nr:phospholipase A [Tannerella sp.]